MTELGSFLQKTLSEKNISRKELCRRSSVSEATISRLLSGERGKNPSPEILNKLAVGLDVPVRVLAEKSGYAIDSNYADDLYYAENLMGNFVHPVMEHILKNEQKAVLLFKPLGLNPTVAEAIDLIHNMSPLEMIKLLQESGFAFNFLFVQNPEMIESENIMVQMTYPAAFVDSQKAAQDIADTLGTTTGAKILDVSLQEAPEVTKEMLHTMYHDAVNKKKPPTSSTKGGKSQTVSEDPVVLFPSPSDNLEDLPEEARKEIENFNAYVRQKYKLPD